MGVALRQRSPVRFIIGFLFGLLLVALNFVSVSLTTGMHLMWAPEASLADCTRVPISAKVVANLLETVGVERVLTMDLHADQIQGFFDIPVDNIYASPVLLGETTENLRDHTVLHGIADTLALRVGDWKYIPANTRGPATGTGGANPTDARFTPNQIPEPMLFNLRDDIGEKNDLALKQLDRTQTMLGELGRWELQAPNPVFREPFDWRIRHLKYYDSDYPMEQPE